MNNGFEALKVIGDTIIDGYTPLKEDKELKQYYKTLERVLLQAREQDFDYRNIVIPFFDELVELLGITDIDDMLDKIKEQHNVLRILKEKRVDGQLIRIADNVEWYNNNYIYRHEIEYLHRDEVLVYQLTEEEFDTVKRWMSDGQSN